MQPLTRIGLARLVVLLVCASGVVLAGDGVGCKLARPICPARAGFAAGALKCKRCETDVLSLMNEETPQVETEDEPQCQTMMFDYYNNDGTYKYYDTSHGELAKCFSPGMLLYDGSLECFGLRDSGDPSTVVGTLERCIGAKSGFYNCLCGYWIDNLQLRALSACFGGTNVPDMVKICPKNQRIAPQFPVNRKRTGRPVTVGKGGRRGRRRSTVDDGSNTNSNSASNGGSSEGSNNGSNDGSNGGSNDGSNDASSYGYDDGSDVDYLVDDWPPVLSDQFSPLLDDAGVSFYLDVWERIVLVNTTTLEVIYYEPYYLYTALSYDTVFPAEKDDNIEENLVRRCWVYPYSNRVWCYQWYMATADLHEYGYVDSNTAVTLGPTEMVAAVTASTGDTAVPTAYTSAAYTTAAAVPSANTRSVSDAAATTTSSPTSSAKPTSTKGSSSAPAPRPAFKSWLAGILLTVIMYDAL